MDDKLEGIPAGEGPSDATQALRDWAAGDEMALERLTPLVYEQLRHQARQLFRRERDDHTLEPTALVHEVFAKLIDADIDWQGRAHFYAVSARMMRRLLINHAKAKRAQKRGGDVLHTHLSSTDPIADRVDEQLVALADALEELERHAPDKARVLEMKYFGGLDTQEMEAVTGRSASSIGRDLRFATAWLRVQLAEEAE